MDPAPFHNLSAFRAKNKLKNRSPPGSGLESAHNPRLPEGYHSPDLPPGPPGGGGPRTKFKIGGWGSEILYGPPRNREIVFRVRVVRACEALREVLWGT